eukprot:403355670
MKSGRALKRYGGEVGSKGLISVEQMPEYFHIINKKIYEDGLFPEQNMPNHVLLNRYRPGDGIMPHKDGPAYFPYVCILSLNSGIMMNIYESVDDISARFYLEPRSLFVFTEKHYTDHFHGIDEEQVDEIIDPETMPDDMKHLGINNLALTAIDQNIVKEKSLQIPRDDERLSLTIRYVPLMKQDQSNE